MLPQKLNTMLHTSGAGILGNPHMQVSSHPRCWWKKYQLPTSGEWPVATRTGYSPSTWHVLWELALEDSASKWQKRQEEGTLGACGSVRVKAHMESQQQWWRCVKKNCQALFAHKQTTNHSLISLLPWSAWGWTASSGPPTNWKTVTGAFTQYLLCARHSAAAIYWIFMEMLHLDLSYRWHWSPGSWG